MIVYNTFLSVYSTVLSPSALALQASGDVFQRPVVT